MKEELAMSSFFDQTEFIILDGAMGTMLQKEGVQAGELPELVAIHAPEKLEKIHRAYALAGSDIICTNTFGANRKKMEGTGYTTKEIVTIAIQIAKKAVVGTKTKVALDMGPLGELLEPAGTLSFEEAYDMFAEIAMSGEEAGADLIIIETMTDLYEAKAALLASVENTSLPVMVSMTFEQDGRTFSGVSIEAMALTLAPLGAAALGINCSLGPAEIMPLAQKLCESTSLPVYVKPNAGLPDPATGNYFITVDEFCEQLEPCFAMGVSIVGGCCGTTPDTIAALTKKFKGKVVSPREYSPKSCVCSATTVLEIDTVCPIGERINPTGKKKLQQALHSGDLSYIQTQAVLQQQDGAKILDVNVGAPGIDEVAILPLVVKAVQAVSDLPLQLDSSNPEALEAALRVYNGKAVVNSTSGEEEKMEVVLPLCHKYGAAVVGLTLDENGIPDKASERLDIARTILERAMKYGMPKQDVFIDCLVLTASAEPKAAKETLEAVRLVKEKLGLKTVLGVSNISFGLPNRPLVNHTFLTLALSAGLDLPILNPATTAMMDAIFAVTLLAGKDKNATAFVERFSGQDGATKIVPSAEMSLQAAVEKGLKQNAKEAAEKLLQSGVDGLTVVNDYLMPALDVVGDGFEKGTIFLPQLIAAADATGAAFEAIKASYGTDQPEDGPLIVLATVKGDIHDIGKNIVRVLLENYGFTVIDLGRDVPIERVVETVKKTGAKLVGLSALMTTTLPSMKQTIEALHEAKLDCKVMVGGAVLTPSYAKEINADFYAKDAKQSVDIAKQVFA